MDDKEQNLVGTTTVGRPSKDLTKVETLRFVFLDFQNQKEQRGEPILSPILKACGFLWKVQLFPYGSDSSSVDTENISLFLRFVGDKNRRAKIKFSIRFGQSDAETIGSEQLFSESTHTQWGWRDPVQRATVLSNYLETDGSLVVEVNFVNKGSKNVWYPDELQQQPILTKFYDDISETGDLVFLVEEKKYYAHKIVLSYRAKGIYELYCEEYTNNGDTTNQQQQSIPISGMKGDILQKILEFIYTVKTPEIKDVEVAVELLLASNRLGVTDLKLYVESIITENYLSITNAATMLVLSDAHTCALLKEAALELFASDTDVVMDSDDWPKVQESKHLLKEIIKSTKTSSLHNKHTNTRTNENEKRKRCSQPDTDLLDITSLREKLQDAGMEIDGSREILIERLVNNQGSS